MNEIRNEILAMLDDDRSQRILASCERVELGQSEILSEAGRPLDRIIFPIEGVISILATYASGDLIEIATVGREGFVGITALVDGQVQPGTYVVQAAGEAYVMKRESFDELVKEDEEFRFLTKRYADVFIYQVMISAACNGAHGVEERLARWLLMMIDRSDEPVVKLTHEFLADIINVRRATITDALKRLEAKGAVRRERGRIELNNRDELTETSCDCYEMVSNYRRNAMQSSVR